MRQYDIYMVDLEPTLGSEMGKVRPCVIVSDDNFGALPSKTIMPITSWKPHFSNNDWMIKINPSKENGLTKVSAIDCYQIANADYSRRFKEKLGTLEPFYVPVVNAVLIDLFNIPNT